MSQLLITSCYHLLRFARFESVMVQVLPPPSFSLSWSLWWICFEGSWETSVHEEKWGRWKTHMKKWLWDFMTQWDLHRLLKSFKWLDHDTETPEDNRIIVTTVPVEETQWLEYSPALRENGRGKEANGAYLPGPLGQHSHCEFSKASLLWICLHTYICFVE